MKIEFTGRRTEVVEPLRRLGERRLAKLLRVLPGLTRAHVVLSNDRHREVAEVIVRSPNLELTARESGPDFGRSLGLAFDKLEKQARHHLGKRLDRKRRGPSPRVAPPRPERPARKGEATPLAALRARRVSVPKLSLEEAAEHPGLRRSGFVLFRDETVDRLQLLVRSREGRLALLEPEA
jgi:putative sigma-54 modulation protein